MNESPFDHSAITGRTWLHHFLRYHKDKSRKPSYAADRMSEGDETSLIISKSEIPQAVWHKDKRQIGELSSAAACLATLIACMRARVCTRHACYYSEEMIRAVRY
jgi:hypothetical protein